MAGVTAQGFTLPNVQDIIADINAQLLADVDPGLDLSPEQPIGQIVGIMAAKLAEVWEALQTAYQAFDPDAAEDYLQDALCAITGTRRLRARPSTCKAVTVNLNAGTTLPAGSVANVAGQPSNQWVTLTTVTNTGGSPANVTVDFASVNVGVFVANAGTLTQISAPVAGWNSVTNGTDAVPGALVETDTALRIRRQAELAAAGGSTVDAMRADLLNVKGVLQAYVFENETMFPDSNGLPPKSLEAVVFDGTIPLAADADVTKVVWGDKPSGIQTWGSGSYLATDSQGNTQPVKWSRPSVRTVYMRFTVTPDAARYPSNGGALVKAAVSATGKQVQNLGVNVVSLVYKAAALTVPGVIDVPLLQLDFTASPTNTANLAIGGREIAFIDTSNILVNGA